MKIALALAALLAAGVTARAERGLTFSEHRISNEFAYLFSVMAADLDGDGDLDLTSADALLNKVYWFENDGRGSFTRHVVHQDEAGWFERNAIGDIDGDGRPDIAVVKNLTGELLWFRNPGAPDHRKPWRRFVIHTDIKRAYDVELTDLDGDGRLDAAASAWVGGFFAWFRNPGPDGLDQAWPRQVFDAEAPESRAIRAADFNLDGKPDLFGTARADNLTAWYENPGQPGAAWPRHVIDNRSLAPAHGQPADLDGDGDPDAVVALGMLAPEAARDSHEVAWYENPRAPGAGWTRHIIGSLAYGFEAVAADLDGDGDLDVVATSCGQIPFEPGVSDLGQIAWFENLGTGKAPGPWRKHILKDRWPSGTQVIVADLDGDRRPDIAAAGEKGSHELIWLRNQGVGELPPPPPPLDRPADRGGAFAVAYSFNSTGWAAQPAGADALKPEADGGFRLGEFKLTIRIAGPLFGSAGPVFTGGKLADGGPGDGCADAARTTVQVRAEYVGDAAPPADGRAGVRLAIDRLRVHAVKAPKIGTAELTWLETTPVHRAAAAAVALRESADLSSASAYVPVEWDPEDFTVEGRRVTRTFAFPAEQVVAIEGLEIVGSVDLMHAAATAP